MKIGLCSVYSWRPHAEQMYFLGQELEKIAGIDVDYMVCRGDLPNCYTRALRPQRSKIVECTLCRLGNFETYTRAAASTLGRSVASGSSNGGVAPLSGAHEEHEDWGGSSAATIMRLETNQELRSEEVGHLRNEFSQTAEIAFLSAKTWIKEKGLDAIIVFNGRMESTRGVSEAAIEMKIPFISVERPWFGHGIQMLPNESCLGLQRTGALLRKWVPKPLKKSQALLGAKVIAERFLRKNMLESRAYNVNASETIWPEIGGRWKVLLLPGSRNEVYGHPDWQEEWGERTDGYDALITRYKLTSQDVVLRAHPAWRERIGSQTGHRSERFYRDWCAKRNITFIPGDSSKDTLSLIRQSDLVVIHASSAALDAGMLGKRVVCLSGTNYKDARFVEIGRNAQQVERLAPLKATLDRTEKRRIIAQTLRFCYAHTNRIPQFVDFVRCIKPTTYEYFSGAPTQRILDMLNSGDLLADDASSADAIDGEEYVVDLVENEAWQAILSEATYVQPGPKLDIARRGIYRFIDDIRAMMPNGDR